MTSASIKKENKNVVAIAASHLLQAIFAVVKIKFLTNFFSIGAYAQYALLLSSLSVSVALVNGGVDFLLSKKLVRAEFRANYLPGYLSRLFFLILCIIGAGVFFYCVMFFLLPSAVEIPLSFLLAGVLFVPLMSINAALLAICKGLNEVKLFARVYLYGSLANSISQCLLVFWLGDAGVSAVVVGGALVQAAIQICLISQIRQKYNLSIKPRILYPRPRFLKAGILIAGSKSYTSAMGMLSQFGLINFILVFAGAAHVASYYLYTGLISQLANLVLIAISGAFFPALLRAKLKGKVYLRDAIFSQSLVITKMVFPLLYLAVIFQDAILSFVASDNFTSTGSLFDYMVCAVFAAVIKQSFDLSLQCHESNKYFMIAATLGGLTFVLIPSVSLYFFGLTGLGVGLLVNSLIWLILVPLAISYLYQFSLFDVKFLQIVIFASLFIILTLNSEVVPISVACIVIAASCLAAVRELMLPENN